MESLETTGREDLKSLKDIKNWCDKKTNTIYPPTDNRGILIDCWENEEGRISTKQTETLHRGIGQLLS